MLQRHSLAITASIIAGVILLYWVFAPRPLLVETAEVSEGQFTALVEEDGRTRVRNRYVVSVPLAGTIARISLRAGDAIKIGQTLASISPNMPPLIEARTRRELEERVGVAEASIEEAKALEERAQAGLVKAQADLQRTSELQSRGVASAAQLDRETAAFQSAGRDVVAADRHRHAAEHAQEQARAALRRSGDGATGERFAVTSPIDGRVLKVVRESEGTVDVGSALLEIGDTSDLEVIVDLLTNEAAGIREGARVLLERTGLPTTLEGRVRHVEPSGFTKISALGVEEQRVWVIVDIASPSDQWRSLGDGYRVGVKIVVEEIDKAVIVPVGSLFRRGNDWTVFVVERDRANERKVDIIRRSGSNAAIAQGLKAGETVVVFPPSTLRSGMSVYKR